MKINTEILEEIGLTKSEIKVYLALLKLGSSTKKSIVKESGITHSKLYEITDKLINKGLVSYVRKNKVLHFSAAPPEQDPLTQCAPFPVHRPDRPPRVPWQRSVRPAKCLRPARGSR